MPTRLRIINGRVTCTNPTTTAVQGGSVVGATGPLSRTQDGAGGNDAVFEEAPDRDQQFTDEGDDDGAAQAPFGIADTLVEPLAEFAGGLPVKPHPGEFDESVPGAAVAGLADALLAHRVAAGPGAGVEADIGSNLSSVAELSEEDLALQNGGGLRADGAQLLQMRDAAWRRGDVGRLGIALLGRPLVARARQRRSAPRGRPSVRARGESPRSGAAALSSVAGDELGGCKRSAAAGWKS